MASLHKAEDGRCGMGVARSSGEEESSGGSADRDEFWRPIARRWGDHIGNRKLILTRGFEYVPRIFRRYGLNRNATLTPYRVGRLT